MVIAIVEPVFAGILVSLINRFVLSGQCCGWLQQSCERVEELVEEREGGREAEEVEVSSTTTIVSDATVHMHYH